jgi:ketosteroid isomerase-like protein
MVHLAPSGEIEVHIRKTVRAALAAAALLVPLAAVPARAQVPLIPDAGGSAESQRFRVEAMQQATETLTDWRNAWANDDVRAMVRLYQKDAMLVLPDGGAPAQGAGAIERALKAALPGVGAIELGAVDAAVDDHLLYIYQRFVVNPGPAGAGSTGTATLVMQRDGGHWKIRAQIFSPEPAQAQAQAASPAAAEDGAGDHH